jgi:hypothetical protein
MLTTAKHYTRSTDTAHAFDVETRTFGSPIAARLWAASKLRGADIVTTNDCYHRDVARAPSVSLHQAGKQIEEITPPVHIVPSCGELGYW